MNRTALVTALLLATTSAYALDARINTGLQIAGMTAEGDANASVAGFKQSAEMKIGAKDRIALAKHYASGKAANKLMGKMFGSTDASAPEAGYESKLVLGAKLDAGLAKSAVNVDASSVAKLGKQPKGTELKKIGDHVVRVDAKTQVVLDVAAISPK